MDKQQEAGTGGKSGIAWLSFLALPVIAVVIYIAVVLFFQPMIFALQGFEVWAARPWLMQPVAVAMAVLALIALFRLPWRRRPPHATWGMLPAALILLLACGVGYGGATLSYGGQPHTVHVWGVSQSRLFNRRILADEVSVRYARDCNFLILDHKAGVAPNTYEAFARTNCACPTDIAPDFIDRWRQERQPYIKGGLSVDWDIPDCHSLAMTVQFRSAASCAFLIYRMEIVFGIKITRGAIIRDPTEGVEGIRDFCYRKDLPNKFTILQPVRGVL